jgi:hypothetical protein
MAHTSRHRDVQRGAPPVGRSPEHHRHVVCWLRRHLDIRRDIVKLGVVVERSRRPRPADRLDSVDQALDPLVLGNAEGVELRDVRPDCESERRATAGNLVDRGDILGQSDGVVQRCQRDTRPQFDTVGDRRQRAQRRHHTREILVCQKVMLGDPGAVESRIVDLPPERQHLVVDLARRALVVRTPLTREQAGSELHTRGSTGPDLTVVTTPAASRAGPCSHTVGCNFVERFGTRGAEICHGLTADSISPVGRTAPARRRCPPPRGSPLSGR